MSKPVRFRVHVSEPFDFERWNESADLFGTSADCQNEEADEWMIELEGWFRFNEADYDVVLVAPRYVGEHLSRVFDSILGFPVRIAHRTPDGWHFAMAGMLSQAPSPPEENEQDDDQDFDEL
ncbi:hypothetical protein [Sphingobium nicotianae]|uniref:Uncharacterized protein n=1 Tax=Sphingobium nicotianae TaxID=2782607 RepID=A0A9X1D9H2_9SPHN|nr:hypothetical protein [Sphingobium nicotianae]MBT2185706.1 hypothetical protein [Sphingobium nicotianae]